VTVAVLRYTVLRIAIFIASLALLYLIGVRESLLMLVFAAVISVALSYVLLGGPRDQLAQELATRVENRTQQKRQRPSGTQADADVEDAAVDAAERRPTQPD